MRPVDAIRKGFVSIEAFDEFPADFLVTGIALHIPEIAEFHNLESVVHTRNK